MKGLYDHRGLIALLVAVVGKEGEEWKEARENALDVIMNIASAGPDGKLGLATHSNLLPNLLLFSTEDGSPSPECQNQSLWILFKIARNTATASLLLTP